MNKNVQALVTYLFLVPLVYFIPPTLSHLIKMSRLLNVILSVGLIVVIMSYLIMPIFMKVYVERKTGKE